MSRPLEANSAKIAEIRGRAVLVKRVHHGNWDESCAADAALDVGDWGDAGDLADELADDVLVLLEVVERDIRGDVFGPSDYEGDSEMTGNPALTARLKAISDGNLDDRTISSGEAAYILKALTERVSYDLNYDQIVQLHAHQIIEKTEARKMLGL